MTDKEQSGMRTIKMGLALMAVLMFSVAMTASSASAALSFLATKLEKLLSTKVETQVFSTENGTVECTEANIEGGTSNDNGEQLFQLALIKYGNCTAFFFVKAEIGLADYLFDAATGLVKIDKLILITVPGNSCETSVPAQTDGTVKYDNSGNNILLLPNVSGINYTANGCSHNGSFTNGTYTGNSEAMIANGTLSFMP
jgi:hypothetical protein